MKKTSFTILVAEVEVSAASAYGVELDFEAYPETVLSWIEAKDAVEHYGTDAILNNISYDTIKDYLAVRNS